MSCIIWWWSSCCVVALLTSRLTSNAPLYHSITAYNPTSPSSTPSRDIQRLPLTALDSSPPLQGCVASRSQRSTLADCHICLSQRRGVAVIMDDFGMIDIDAPLPDDAAQIDIIDVAPSTSATTAASRQSHQQQSSVGSPVSLAADGLADIPPLEHPSDIEHSPQTATSSSSAPLSTAASFEPPVLAAPTTRFLDSITPLKQPTTDSATTSSSPAAPTDAVSSSLRDQLSAYKRRKTEHSSARSQLNALIKRGGEDFIDLSAYSAMPSPLPPPPVRPSSTSADRSTAAQSTQLFAPWMVREYRHTNFTLRLHEELLDFAAFISPTAAEEKHRAALLSRLAALTTSLFPSSNLRPFGSYATKLYLPMGDIDCCLFDAPTTALHQLHRALEREGWVSYLEHITSARIPIIKFMDRSSGLRVDVCVEQTVGLEAAQYITQMSVKLPAFRPLLLFLKYFLHVRRLNDTYSGGVGSYLLQLMLLSHLHHHPSQTHDTNLGLLLLSFFDTYGNQLNYQNVGLSLSPPSFYSKHDRQRFNPQRPLLLSVENPLDSSHDVGVNSFGVMRVRRAMQYAYGRLTERSVMEGRWEGSLLSIVLGVLDDEELRERGEKKEREREKRPRREGDQTKEKEKQREKEERKEKRKEKKKKKKRVEEEEEEGEIVVEDDTEDEHEAEKEKEVKERDEQNDDSLHEHKYNSEEEKYHDDEETKDASNADEHDVQPADEREQPTAEEKAKRRSMTSTTEQSASASSPPLSSSSTSSSSSSPSTKWRPGQPFPHKWLRLFVQRDVSAILEQIELDESAQAEAVKQFTAEKEVWMKEQREKQQLARTQQVAADKQQRVDKQSDTRDSEEKEQSELRELLKQKCDNTAERDVSETRREAEERYFSTWTADKPIPDEWLRLFKPSQLSAMLDKRPEVDERTKRRVLLDFKRDRYDLLDSLKTGRERVVHEERPMTVDTWKPSQPIPEEWLKIYSVQQVKEMLDKRSELGKKSRKRMLQHFKEDKQAMKQLEKDARDKRAAEELREQPGLYEVEEEWLSLPKAQVDKLLQERGLSNEARTTVLREWKAKLSSKTDGQERKRRTTEGTWTKQDEQEWVRWKRLQKYAKIDLPKQDGMETFIVPSEWLEWDRQKVKGLLKDWHIRGDVKDEVLRQWKEKRESKAAGLDEEKKDGGESGSRKRKVEKKKSDERLKEELKKLMMFKQQEKRRREEDEQQQHDHTDATMDSEKRKRQREDEERSDQKPKEERGSASKRQREEPKEEKKQDDSESAAELSERWREMPKPQRKLVQAEVLQRLKKEIKARGDEPRSRRRGAFPHTGEEKRLYDAEWKKAVEERLEEESHLPAAQQSDDSASESVDQLRLSSRNRALAKGLARAAVMKRIQEENDLSPLFSLPPDINDRKVIRATTKQYNSKTAAEWLQILSATYGAAQVAADNESRPEEVIAREKPSVVKQARKRVITRLREKRRKEYEARGAKPPSRLNQLFPVNGSDQRLIEEELARELSRQRDTQAGKQVESAEDKEADEESDDEDSKQKVASVASAAAAPEVIDLVDDNDGDEMDDSVAAGVRSAVADEDGWAEETSARPKRRLEGDEEVTSRDEEATRASKHVKVDANQLQSTSST